MLTCVVSYQYPQAQGDTFCGIVFPLMSVEWAGVWVIGSQDWIPHQSFWCWGMLTWTKFVSSHHTIWTEFIGLWYRHSDWDQTWCHTRAHSLLFIEFFMRVFEGCTGKSLNPVKGTQSKVEWCLSCNIRRTVWTGAWHFKYSTFSTIREGGW
jgi:hypothetical protein